MAINLRSVGKELQQALKVRAAAEGVTIESLCVRFLWWGLDTVDSGGDNSAVEHQGMRGTTSQSPASEVAGSSPALATKTSDYFEEPKGQRIFPINPELFTEQYNKASDAILASLRDICAEETTQNQPVTLKPTRIPTSEPGARAATFANQFSTQRAIYPGRGTVMAQDPNNGRGTLPTMQELRDICAGKMPVALSILERDSISDELLASDVEMEMQKGMYVEPEIPICGRIWWEDGEHCECLMDAGHKSPKHGQNGMVRKLDD